MESDQRCSSCGFMGLKNKDTGEIEHASYDFRERGTFNRHRTEGIPFCDKRIYNLEEESLTWIREQTGGRVNDASNTDAVKSVLQKPRQCTGWMAYVSGKSPIEHRDMISQTAAIEAQARSADALARSAEAQSRIADLQAMFMDWRKEQAESQKEQAAEQRKWEMRLQALEQTRHNETITVAKSEAAGTNWQAWGTIVAVTVSLVALVLGLLGYLK